MTHKKLCITLIISLIVFSGCQWDYKEKEFLQVELLDSRSINDHQVVVAAKLSNTSVNSISEFGFSYSELNSSPTISDNFIKIDDLSPNRVFMDTISGLKVGTVYYIRPYLLLDNEDIFYGELGLASTFGVQIATDTVLVNFVSSSAEAFGIINGITNGSEVLAEVDEHGHCWTSEMIEPTINCVGCGVSQLGGRQENGLFRSQLENLSQDVTYRVRAYAVIGDSTIYGQSQTFAIRSSWSQLVDFPGGERGFSAGFSIEGKGYLGTGVMRELIGGASTFFNDFYSYDPSTNSWETLPPVPGTNRAFAVGFELNGKGYFGTGSVDTVGNDSITYLQDFYEFDPHNLSNPWRPVDPYPRPVEGAFSFTIGDRGYVGSGEGPDATFTSREFLNEFWEFDPKRPSGEQWKRKADFPGVSRIYGVGFSIDEIGYVGTGLSQLTIIQDPILSFEFTALKDFWAYDPTTDQWERKVDTPLNERAFTAGFELNNKGYIGLGSNPSLNAFRDFYEYSPLTNEWTQVEDLRVANGRVFSLGLNIGEKGYIGMGLEREGNTLNIQWLTDFWQFNP